MYIWLWLMFGVLLNGLVLAFYPYKPAEHEADSPHTLAIPARQSTGLPSRTISSITKLPIKREAPLRNPNPYLRSIAKEKARACQSPNDTASGSTPVKRDNEYDIITAAQPSQANSIAVDEDGTDFSYFSALSFGSAGKTMYMLIDTGAANTWVMGANCTSDACERHNTLGEQDSKTLEATGSTFNLTYGTGSISGVTVNDTVEIAGMSVPLSFGAASDTSDDFLAYPMDGILGLGRSASNAMEYPTAMEAIRNTGLLQSNIFGIHLQRFSDGSTDGELNFGAPDTSRYTGELSYTDTVADGVMWEVPLDDASYDGNFCRFSGKSAILDTGTSYVLLPPDDAQQLHAQIPRSEGDGETFNIPCLTSIPIQIIISGVEYNISTEDYIGNPVEGETCVPATS
ncbi:hypothetical protein G7Y79_00048g084340 [Physcia stellaris]|nr:hypothetical protein G7Y79_00048g084340 [Physcia stellaris]